MNNKKPRFTSRILGISALLTSLTPVYASEANSGFYLVPSMGYQFTHRLDHYRQFQKAYNAHPDDAGNSIQIHFNNGTDYGIAFGYQLDGHNAIELAYNYTPFDIETRFRSADNGTTTVKEETSFQYAHIDYVYFLNDVYSNNFSFYIPAGLGFMKNDPKNKNHHDEGHPYKVIEDFDINVGVGAYYQFSDHFGIRSDVRGIYGFDQHNFDMLIQVGLTFRLGDTGPAKTGPSIQTASIRFKFDSTEIINKDDPDLGILAQTLRDNPGTHITVLAYSSRSGTTEYNMRLSQRRAAKLKKVLIEDYGVAPDRIQTRAYGDEYGVSKERRAVALVEY